MNIYKLRNRFGYRATSIIRFACHNKYRFSELKVVILSFLKRERYCIVKVFHYLLQSVTAFRLERFWT